MCILKGDVNNVVSEVFQIYPNDRVRPFAAHTSHTLLDKALAEAGSTKWRLTKPPTLF